jgi:hypothetical protein
MTENAQKQFRLLKFAAERADWMQVALNCAYGPPCFHFEPDRGRFCLRAKSWAGHDGDPHKYVSLADLLATVKAVQP